MRILIVEDEALFARAVEKRLSRGGHDCQVAGSIGQAEAQLDAAGPAPDLVLLDERLPDGSGVELMLSRQDAAGGRAMPPVIMMTAFADIDHAVSAMKLGALDYIRKPVDLDRLFAAVSKVGERPRAVAKLPLSMPEAGEADLPAMIGESGPMAAARARILELAALDGGSSAPSPTVLITGATGTGKEVAANLLHAAGPRQDRPFIEVDCTALPRELFESELFGHEKGAFTGAARSKAGLVESAGRGTLFLDEIGELPLEAQAKLLALLDRRRYRRVGGNSDRAAEARFVAATNRDLEAMVAQGTFRSDLLYRLRVLSVHLPSLCDMPEDVPRLAGHFAAQTAALYGRTLPEFEPEAMELLRRHAWPGNVRELKHVVERAVLLDQDGRVTRDQIELVSVGLDPAQAGPKTSSMSLGESERRLIEDALARAGGNVSKAARLLGVTRMTLRYRIEKHAIAIPGKDGT